MKSVIRIIGLPFTCLFLACSAGAFPIDVQPPLPGGPHAELSGGTMATISGLKFNPDNGEISSVFPIATSEELIFGDTFRWAANKSVGFPAGVTSRSVADLNDFTTRPETLERAIVPEPVTMLLLGLSLIGLAGIGRRLKR